MKKIHSLCLVHAPRQRCQSMQFLGSAAWVDTPWTPMIDLGAKLERDIVLFFPSFSFISTSTFQVYKDVSFLSSGKLITRTPQSYDVRACRSKQQLTPCSGFLIYTQATTSRIKVTTLFSPGHSDDEDGSGVKLPHRPAGHAGGKHRRHGSTSSNSSNDSNKPDRKKVANTDKRPPNPFIEEVCKQHKLKSPATM